MNKCASAINAERAPHVVHECKGEYPSQLVDTNPHVNDIQASLCQLTAGLFAFGRGSKPSSDIFKIKQSLIPSQISNRFGFARCEGPSEERLKCTSSVLHSLTCRCLLLLVHYIRISAQDL